MNTFNFKLFSIAVIALYVLGFSLYYWKARKKTLGFKEAFLQSTDGISLASAITVIVIIAGIKAMLTV